MALLWVLFPFAHAERVAMHVGKMAPEEITAKRVECFPVASDDFFKGQGLFRNLS